MKTTMLLALCALAACSSSPTRQQVSFAKLSFEIPDDWSRREQNLRGESTGIWTPSANDRRESVTLIRTQLAPAVAQAGSPALDGLVEEAETGLPGAKATRVVPFLTRTGLSGVRAEFDFLPPGQSEPYHRVHVVLVGRDRSLVHVLYTARTPDADLDALNTVLTTIREGEG